VLTLAGIVPDRVMAGGRLQQAAPAPAPRLTLERLVHPDTRVHVGGRLISFALHGLIRFDSLAELFTYVDSQAGRWRFATAADRQAFGDDLLRRGVESRVVSMQTELPLEVLVTHTPGEIEEALGRVPRAARDAVFAGRYWTAHLETYRAAFLRVRDRWTTSLNCWSAASTIPARVLSNWYLIDEGIPLFGATYDSTEHFWQAVKYHPDLTLEDLRALARRLTTVDWSPWLAALEADQAFYFANAYAVEFLRHNLTRERLAYFDQELARAGAPGESARAAQQRIGRGPGAPVRFTSLQEKVLWGDLADVLHLIVTFSARPHMSLPAGAAGLRDSLVEHGFDAIYLPGYAGGRVPFLSTAFQDLMFEIWKVKYLQLPRFGEVIRSTVGKRLDHFLDDGNSPDIPIPVYVDQLNRIRDLALRQSARR
jgi:hypothetical protein